MSKAVDSIRKVFTIFKESRATIKPHFILTGPSGSGKSFAIEQLSNEYELSTLTVNAAGLTKEGTAGNSLSKALTPLMNLGDRPAICFVDEFDKLFISGNTNSDLAHEITHGVQNEFLKVLEGYASIYGDYGKYINLPTDNILFIFAGAFNNEENITLDRLREFGVKTEFLGRVGLCFSLPKMGLEQMWYILQTSPLLATYLQLFPDVSKDVVLNEVMTVVNDNHDKNGIGVRLLNTLIHQYFINGGIKKVEAERVAFQKTLKL